jgi:ribonuclease VapC
LKLLDAVARRLVSAVTLYETSIVMLARAGADGVADLNELLQEISAEIIPFDHAQATAALAAYGRYGKGFDRNARLNLGDCASYALAKGLNAPLLFKGTDFAATDVIVAA